MLTDKEVKEIKEDLDSCKKPMIFFDDDPDGLCSFLLFYRYVGDGRGIPLKIPGEMGPNFARKVEDYCPDKIFILDRPMVSQDFFDKVKQQCIWIDHHPPIERHNVKYYNPRKKDKNINSPASYLCYQVTKKDLWISMIGTTADWVVHRDIEKVKKEYPDLVGKNQKNPEDLLFDSKFGKLAKILSFCLKGKMDNVTKCIKILTRIKTPYELLNQETPQAKFIYKRFMRVEEQYQEILQSAEKKFSEDDILLYIYDSNKMSLSKDLSNELLYKFPEKIIILGRKNSGEVKLSIRAKNLILQPILKKALEGCEGYGGGHEHACGANVKENDFDKFLEQFKEQIKKEE